ncbi:MAG: PQQ-like beta-propeller repeat protein [Acidobacteria bacterium]|nr:PQQ-like beta-propeller repeat protein [Acidobacteriota bacterium]
MFRFFSPFLVAVLTLVSAIPAATREAGENWPQWRGPGGQGVSSERQLPTEWGPDKNIAWKTTLPGSGHSSPIVWGERIFLTSAVEGEVVPGAKPVTHMMQGKEWVHPSSVAGDRKHTLKVLALDAKSGKLLWEQTAFEGPVFDARHERSSFAAPTAATDGQMVFAYFGPEGLYGYDFSGELVWKSLVRFPTLGLGTGTSPVLFKDLAIIQRDEDEGRNSAIVAYDKQKGTEIWKTKRAIQISWSTPVLVEAGRRTALVTNGTELVIACDPATGKELWQTNGVDSNAIHTPLVGHGLVIMTADYPAKKVIAIRPGDVSEDKRVAWEYSKGTGYVLSNILYGDYLYLLTDNGIVTCLDPKTGVVKYEGGRVPVPARFMGSPVAFADSVAMTSEDGDTFMLKAGPAHEIARTNSVDEPVYSSPAIANGRIYIRGQKHLFAIGPKA